MNRVVVCQIEGVIPPVLTRWNYYEVLAEDATPCPMLRVRADDGAARWFPAVLFAPADTTPPRMVSWQFDELVPKSGRAFIEISMAMSDGTRRWCNVVTLPWLRKRLADPQQCPGIYLGQTLVVRSLAPEDIEATLRDLERYKHLTDATRLLAPCDDEEEYGPDRG